MKNEQLYKETVDIILDAYNDGHLISGSACGCFVGNIVARRMGIAYNAPGYNGDWWYGVIYPINSNHASSEFVEKYGENGMKQIKVTGYSIQEVAKLEKAFENAATKLEKETDGSCSSIQKSYVGMDAALKVLAEIHETDEKESIVRLDKIYKEKYETCPC